LPLHILTTLEIDIISSPDAADGDVEGRADAAGAVVEVIGKVIDLIQGLIDGDTKVSGVLKCQENP